MTLALSSLKVNVILSFKTSTTSIRTMNENEGDYLYQCFLMILHNETLSNRLSPCSCRVSFFKKPEYPKDDGYELTEAQIVLFHAVSGSGT
jgi:hypothetical protein